MIWLQTLDTIHLFFVVVSLIQKLLKMHFFGFFQFLHDPFYIDLGAMLVLHIPIYFWYVFSYRSRSINLFAPIFFRLLSIHSLFMFSLVMIGIPNTVLNLSSNNYSIFLNFSQIRPEWLIISPRLNYLHSTLFSCLIVSDPQLIQFLQQQKGTHTLLAGNAKSNYNQLLWLYIILCTITWFLLSNFTLSMALFLKLLQLPSF